MILTVDLHELVRAPGYWYLGTPYTRYAEGLDAAWRAAARLRGKLLAAGVSAFSPIVESHAVSVIAGLDPLDLDIWIPDNCTKMEAAYGLLVGRLPGWEQSTGLRDEIEFFRDRGKPIVHVDP